jgi:undecaprenyl-diphosphatase
LEERVGLELWQAAVLGLVEGITEFLPISSTGHLILASSLMGLDRPEIKSSLDAFQIVVQGGAILAVLSIYWPAVLRMLRGMMGKDAAGLRLAVNLVIAFIPAAVLGVLLDDWIESRLFHAGPVLGALAAGGVYMIVVERWARKRAENRDQRPETGATIESLTPGRALFIGLMQCVAMWPGMSRSMMTITGGMFVGLPAAAAAEFGFLLGLPTLGGATAYKLYKNFSHAKQTGTPNLFEQLGTGAVVLGMAVAAVSAAIAVKWLVGFLKRRGLTAFGVYRIVLAAALGGLLLAGMLRIAPEPGPATPQMQGR